MSGHVGSAFGVVEPQMPALMPWSHSFMTASGVGYVETYCPGRVEVQMRYDCAGGAENILVYHSAPTGGAR